MKWIKWIQAFTYNCITIKSSFVTSHQKLVFFTPTVYSGIHVHVPLDWTTLGLFGSLEVESFVFLLHFFLGHLFGVANVLLVMGVRSTSASFSCLGVVLCDIRTFSLFTTSSTSCASSLKGVHSPARKHLSLEVTSSLEPANNAMWYVLVYILFHSRTLTSSRNSHPILNQLTSSETS